MADLQGVEFCHHDMTVENILLDKGNVIFIDPGVSRGLDCREQDESKLLQSTLTQWEHLTRPAEFGLWTDEEPFEIKPAHLALLACHWIRIGCHFEKHSEAVKTAAPRMIKAIRDALRGSKDDDCGIVGHRRGVDRLRTRCLAIVQECLQDQRNQPA